MAQVREYQTPNGKSPFEVWFDGLEARAAARVRRTIDKIERGLKPDVKPVGEGVFEARIDYGPGYRVYFGLDGDEVVILVGGGAKAGQSRDIAAAQARWADYKKRKR